MKSDNTKAHLYGNLVNLLAIYSETHNNMTALQASVQGDYMELIDAHKPEYAKLQALLGETEASLEILAKEHPEWFPEDRKSIKTPYGTVKLTTATSLVVANEEATILLIQHAGMGEKFLRQKTEINREALETLTDEELKPLRVKRVKDQSFSVTPAKLDMGKAVKDADKASEKKGAA